jgi:hypothetical protein
LDGHRYRAIQERLKECFIQIVVVLIAIQCEQVVFTGRNRRDCVGPVFGCKRGPKTLLHPAIFRRKHNEGSRDASTTQSGYTLDLPSVRFQNDPNRIAAAVIAFVVASAGQSIQESASGKCVSNLRDGLAGKSVDQPCANLTIRGVLRRRRSLERRSQQQ